MMTRLTRWISRPRRDAALVRSAAGLAAGVDRRRGTVLVLVIGALALISVITLVYFGIGQADRRGSTSAVQHAQVDNTAELIGEYIAQKVADGVVATHVQGRHTPTTGNAEPVLVRTAADYPATDPYRISVVSAGTLQDRAFDPTGSYSTLWQNLTDPDPRIPATPLLASTEPITLVAQTSGTIPDFETFRDWLHITNVAPDGRFVNLWNLAPIINGERYGNIRAQSVGPTEPANNGTWAPAPPTLVGSEVISSLSYRLSLFDLTTGNPTTQLDPGARRDPNNPLDPNADPNRPAHWDSRQARMFRPATGPNFFPTPIADPVTPGLNANSPGSVFYPPYQYCDTDGDGMFDARWFELVDAKDPRNLLSLLPGDGRFRWFAAARVVDLNAFVNVNTATEFRAPDTAPAAQATRFGSSPADIDLWRLLTMDDLYNEYGVNTGYTLLERPFPVNTPEDYFAYNRAAAQSAGSLGYQALRLSLRGNGSSVYPYGTTLPQAPNRLRLWNDSRFQYYLASGDPSGSYSRINNLTHISQSSRFSIADLKELLTRWGINDARSTSRLEQAVDNRYDQANGGSAATSSFGPLRSSRGETLERRGLDNAENPVSTPPAGLGDGRADRDAMALSVFDVRHRITTLSAARPIRSSVLPLGPAGQTARNQLSTNVDLGVNVLDALRNATQTTAANRDPSRILIGYADGLMPYAGVKDAWRLNDRMSTLSFGRSAELALRSAAHLTANLIDSYDPDHTPRGYTLLINEDQRSAVTTDLLSFPWWQQPGTQGKLDAKTARLAHTSTGDPQPQASSGAINVFGIEAQPFLVQAATIFLYTDAPNSASNPGDNDNQNIAPPGPYPEITIDGSRGAGNPDFLGEVIAFTLVNPFDVEVELSVDNSASATNPFANDDFTNFYIQFGGAIYKLAEIDSSGQQQPIKLRPGESRVVYCPGDDAAAYFAKWRNVETTLSDPTIIQRFVTNQFAHTPSPGVTYQPTDLTADGRVRPLQIRRINATTATPIATGDLLSPTTSANRDVMLWRALRTAADATPAINQRRNDMLADVLRDPGGPGSAPGNFISSLDRRLDPQNISVSGTDAAPEPTPDNSGYTIATWGTIKRRNDPGDTSGTTPRGAIPAYCIEAKWSPAAGVGLQNKGDSSTSGPGALTKAHFTLSRPNNADTSPLPLFNRLAPTLSGGAPTYAGVLIPSITICPQDWRAQAAANPSRFPSGSNAMPPNLDTPPRNYDTLYPVIHLNNNRFEATSQPTPAPANSTTPPSTLVSTFRLADLLLPLGIGPMQDPGIPAGTDPTQPWLCLSEALALGLNYSTPAAGAPGWGLYARMGDSVVGVLDRGHLSLERGAPFEDVGADGDYDAGTDFLRSPGIPLALNVLNQFSALDPQFGNLTHATPGLLNINTAGTNNLRLVPLVSPTTEPGPTRNGVWAAFKTAAGVLSTDSVPEPPGTAGAITFDVAAAWTAYRDKLNIVDREQRLIEFGDDITNASAFDTLAQQGRASTTQPLGPGTGRDAAREARGFQSTAEIMAVINRAGSTRLPPGGQINALGSDAKVSGALAMNSTLIADPLAQPAIDRVIDDYSEKLLIAQAALGTVTVRSDLFAVWYVVHGYQQSDTENLGLRDVLKPSIAKRYLMVLDRSNVTRKGEKPRVVLFTEVPM